MPSDPIVPDHIRAAIHAGHVGQVVIFCDRCGIEEAADYTGETREIRFAAARKHLADTKAWAITEAQDLCPKCSLPDQPNPKLSQPINLFDIPGSPDAYACRRPVYIGDVGYAEPCGRELPCPDHPAPVPGSPTRGRAVRW